MRWLGASLIVIGLLLVASSALNMYSRNADLELQQYLSCQYDKGGKLVLVKQLHGGYMEVCTKLEELK
jgi:hypothetical protein